MSAKFGKFSVKERREEKQRSRDSDLARLASNRISAKELGEENGFSLLWIGRKRGFSCVGPQSP